MKVCYYKILGISVRASREEIKKAFRVLAMCRHPDRNPEDPTATERFREVLEAYETLVDPSRRVQYDRLRGYKKSRGKTGRPSGKTPRTDDETVEEILRGAFGVRNIKTPARKTCDLRFDLQVSRSAARTGVYEFIDYERRFFCSRCNGHGRGMSGGACADCGGSGVTMRTCRVRLKVPAGIGDGDRLRLRGAGDRPSPGDPAGDLVVLIFIVDLQETSN